VQRRFRTLIVVTGLVLCTGAYLLELSGHWDQTLKDTSDELSMVLVVACVGATLLIADTLTNTITAPRTTLVNAAPARRQPRVDRRWPIIAPGDSPPRPLRI
jgi:hypothetical protein